MDTAIEIIKNVLLIIPAIWGFHTWLYSKFPKYYFFVVRRFSKWRDTNWSVNVDYRLPELGDTYKKIEEILKRRYQRTPFKRSVNMANKKLYECGIFNILVQDDFDNGEISSRSVFVRIAQINVTLNTAEEKLRELRGLFNEIHREIVPLSSGYNLDVHFKDGNNPFFGLMVQRLGKSNVAHFECFFPISAVVPKSSEVDIEQHNLRVYKEKLCINESTFDIVEETAKRALLFK